MAKEVGSVRPRGNSIVLGLRYLMQMKMKVRLVFFFYFPNTFFFLLYSMDWIRKMYIYTMEYYSAMKKNKIMLFAATWMELETLVLSEVKSERERQVPYGITYIGNLIYGTNEPTYRKETNSWTWTTHL